MLSFIAKSPIPNPSFMPSKAVHVPEPNAETRPQNKLVPTFLKPAFGAKYKNINNPSPSDKPYRFMSQVQSNRQSQFAPLESQEKEPFSAAEGMHEVENEQEYEENEEENGQGYDDDDDEGEEEENDDNENEQEYEENGTHKNEKEKERVKYIESNQNQDSSSQINYEDISISEINRLKGLCTSMCPEEEILSREEYNDLDMLECYPGTKRANPNWVVKKYQRSTPGKMTID